MVSNTLQEQSERKMTMRALVILLIFTVALVASPIPGIQGVPEYASELPEALKNFCQVCHVRASGGPMNSFGDDYVSHGSVGAIGELDSDDDGFSNEDELEAGSLPGDPDSTPDSKKSGMNLIYVMGGTSLLLVAAGVYFRLRSKQSS